MKIQPHQHRWIYLISLSMVAVGLPLSKAFMSIGGIAMAINFLWEGDFHARFKKLRKAHVALFLIAVFGIHVVALLWTSDIGHALSDIRIKLPMLLFPIAILLSAPLSRKELQVVIGLFVASVIFTSFLSTWHYVQIKDDPTRDYRSISLFTSHIRYALMVCLSYIILLNMAWNEKENVGARLSYILFAVWLSFFVFILQSMTGIVIWLLCSYLLLIYTFSYIKARTIKTVVLTIITITPIFVGLYIILQVDAYYPDQRPDFSALETHTAGGDIYDHDTNNLMLENGHYINLYRAFHELEVEWNKRSDLPFWGGTDATGQLVNATLMRYLTSKGLRKDSAGVAALSASDVHAIEQGVANVRFTYGNALDNRLYTVIWEFDRMLNEKRVQGHSVTQRIVFWKTGLRIFKENWLFGVGTGDANAQFDSMYDRLGVKLTGKYRLRAHNQFLTIGITFGALGLLIFLSGAILPFFTLKNANSFLYIGFAIIIYASMINEDTLETQAGVTLYSFFNSLLLFGSQSLLDEDSA